MDTTLRKPYDFYPAMERLMNHADELSADERRALKEAVVLNAPDPRAVALHVDLTGDNEGEIYPPRQEEAPITTGDAIDTFLDRYGHSTPAEDALLEKLIFNPVPEYSQVLAAGEADEGGDDDSPDALASLAAGINGTDAAAGKGIERSVEPEVENTAENEAEKTVGPDDGEPVENEVEPAAAPAAVPDVRPRPKRAGDAPLTLELAKIFIKQGQFDRAYEIISKISLNNPEKSAYFADQLRFIEKVMALQRATKARKADK